MKRFQLSRRSLLRGAGATVALPLLEAMLPARAAAQSAEAKRLVVFHWPQGVPTGWAPPADDLGWFPKAAGAGYTVPACLKPLEPYRQHFNVVSGVGYTSINRSVGSHGHAVAMFTGYRPSEVAPNQPAAGGPSVDQLAAKTLCANTRFGGLVTGLWEVDEIHWTWSSQGARVPAELNPRALFDRLFGAGVPGAQPTPTEDAASRRARSVLDVVKADVARLKPRLGASDNRRLDEHLESIRALERAVTSAPAAPMDTCSLPSRPGAVTYGMADFATYADLMTDLCMMALRCDLTRVVFMSLGPSQNYMTFPTLGITDQYHSICHGVPAPTDQLGKYRKVATLFMERVAHLFQHLTTADATGGTLLDSSAVIAASEFGDGGLHRDYYLPVIVAGKAGRPSAAAMQTGKNLVFRCQQAQDFQNAAWCRDVPGTPNRCINDVWTSALQAVGALSPGAKFGDPTLNTVPLEGLWV